MAQSLAKLFEAKLKEDWYKLPYSTIDRLYDPVGGFHGISNICDFIGYSFPFHFYLECKTVKSGTFSFSNLKQYSALLTKKGIKGVIAGAIIWFYGKDAVIFAPIEEIEKMKNNGEKSISIKKVVDNSYNSLYNIIQIPSTKKITFMDSDYSVLIDFGYTKLSQLKQEEDCYGK